MKLELFSNKKGLRKIESFGKNIGLNSISRDEISISIVMPVYNCENYIHESIASLRNQTFLNFEIICVDDGSDDSSLEILNSLSEEDSRITVITKKHTNAGDTRNVGLAKAKGKYILFLDADDFFEKTMLEVIFAEAEKSQAEITVFSGDNYSESNRQFVANPGLLRRDIVPEGTFNLHECRGRISFTSTAPWNKLYLRSFIQDNNLLFQSVQSANDLYFVTVSLLLAKTISTIDVPLVHYRTDNLRSLQGSPLKSPYDGLAALKKIYEELSQRDLIEEFKIDFNERTISICLYLMKRIDKAYLFEEFYEYLRNVFIPSVGLESTVEKDFYNSSLYNELKLIIKYAAREYLFIKYQNSAQNNNCKWLFPFREVSPNSEIILYGAGNVGKCFYSQIKKTGYCRVIEWVDQKELWVNGNKTISPDKTKWQADYIVIAIENEAIANKVKELLTSKGVNGNIVWQCICCD